MGVLFESITFDRFCTLLKRYKRTYEKIALSINCTERTLRRYRKGEEPYISLSEDKYNGLFKCLENECNNTQENIIQVIVEFFDLPSVYLSKNYSELKNIIIYNLDNKIQSKADELPFGTRKFLQECLKNKNDIKEICIAFQSGWTWTESTEMMNLIQGLNDSGIKIRMIANSESAIKKIALEMRDPNLTMFYKGFNETLSKWHEWELKLNNFELRVSEYPILRIFCVAIYKDETKKAIFRDYVYGSAPDSYTFIQLSNENPALTIFMREFDFHLKKSKTYSGWFLTLPKKEEIISSRDYILLYLRQQKNNKNDNPLSEFVVSSLSIENNNVKLHTNIENTTEITNPEYTYEGKLKLTRRTIFITLHDCTEQEHISILFSRPLHDKDRFLGIMTALSPNGQPIALKCVCISRAILQKLDIQQLKQILSNNNQEWNSNLMILEEKDINRFYSNTILD